MPSYYYSDDRDARRASERRRNESPDRQSDRGSMSNAPGQEHMPKGLNEDYYRESAAAMGIPLSNDVRSNSVPPRSSALVHRPASPSPPSSRSSSPSGRGRVNASSYPPNPRGHDPLHDTEIKARGLLQNHFSQTRAGIGAGIVGAVVGGLVAKQASEAAFSRRQGTKGRQRRRHRSSESQRIPRIVSTVLGAVAGGLGANAITHHVEEAREKSRHQHIRWERGSSDGAVRYDGDRSAALDYQNGLACLESAGGYDREYDDDWRNDKRQRRHRIKDN